MPIVKGFRRFQPNIVSFSQVVNEISNLVPGSNVQQCGWCSDSSSNKRKRITISDRRVLLESFVNKYRAMNSGKFPPTKTALKEVGGSHYTIKKMIQEMEYNFKLSSMEKVPETIKQTSTSLSSREIGVKSSTSEKVSKSNRQITMDQNLYKDAWLESAAAAAKLDTKSEQVKKGLEPSIGTEDTKKKNNITRDDTQNIANDTRADCNDKLENHAKDESQLEDKFGLKDSNSKVEQQQQQQHDDGISNTTRDMTESKKDLELREKTSSSSSIWGNLKSLASGFINIWKKQ